MSSLPKSFLPILIALTLLLSATASGGEGMPPDDQTHPQATVTFAEHTAPTPVPQVQGFAPAQKNYARGLHRALTRVWRVVSSQELFNAILTVATVLIAVFNYQLLFLNWPLLVADRPTPRFFSPREREKALEEGKVFFVASANCPFRNVGQSPAIISKIVVKMKLDQDLPMPPSFADCEETTAIKDAVVPASSASDFFSIYIGNEFSDDEWKLISRGKVKVVLYGQITYKGMLWKKYVMNFGFVYEPPNSGLGPGNLFRFGRKEYNTRT
jgi:hypothetical protein